MVRNVRERIRGVLAAAACLALFSSGCGGGAGRKAPASGPLEGTPLARSRAASAAGAGSPAEPRYGRDASARFCNPCGIAIDGSSLYVADMNNGAIRKIALATGAVTTLAGSPGSAGSSDGAGAAARFSTPSGIAASGASLYVADRGSHTIRKVAIATRAVTTLAGMPGSIGSADGKAGAARFFHPYGIATDGTSLYVADMFGQTIRRIAIATGTVTTLAGSAGLVGSSDGRGKAAAFYYPSGIATDGTNLYVADKNNHTIRKVTIATGAVSTLAGKAGAAGSADGAGAAARFFNPFGIAADGTTLYVSDTSNHTIRAVAIATGQVRTLAGEAGAAGH